MSAIIGIRCDECGAIYHEPIGYPYGSLVGDAERTGWLLVRVNVHLCPFCVARRKAKQQAEAAAK